MSVIGIFVVTAFVASSILRDFTRETHELFFSRPIRKIDYLMGRFVGSLAISFLVIVGAALGRGSNRRDSAPLCSITISIRSQSLYYRTYSSLVLCSSHWPVCRVV
jgi:ABC-type Na+ efflux pump permease subunit